MKELICSEHFFKIQSYKYEMIFLYYVAYFNLEPKVHNCKKIGFRLLNREVQIYVHLKFLHLN